VGRLAIQMNRYKRSRAWRYGCFDERRIYVVRTFIGLYGNGLSTTLRYGKPCCDVRVRGNDHLVPGAYTVCAQDEVQRLQPITHSHAMLRATIACELTLELL